MMKNSVLYILLVMIMGCASKKEMPHKDLIYYGKTACLGKCPVFDVFIYDDGKVTYKGIKNVEKIGKHSFTISKTMLQKIQNEIAKLNVEKTDKPIRDLPNTIIKFSGKKLVIQNFKNIRPLDELIQQIINN